MRKYVSDRANQILVKGKLVNDGRVTTKCNKASKEAGECIIRMDGTILSAKEFIKHGNVVYDNLDQAILFH